MKNFLIALLVFLVWSVFGLYMYSLASPKETIASVDSQKISEVKKETEVGLKESTSQPVEIENTKDEIEEQSLLIKSLDNQIIFEATETITIEKDLPEVSLSNELKELPSALTTYLSEHPGQELHITSYYSASASLQTPNIGQQRGDHFKKMLLELGADDNQLVVKPVLSTADFDQNNTLANGMTFAFKLLNRERIANYKAAIPEQITFYPSYNFDELLANQKLTDFTNQVVAIHQENPNLKIIVVGHTDHIGAASENYVRGLKSARQIRWYLINKGGIARDMVSAISKGETEPLLREGKPASLKENARIEIQFIEEK